MRGLDLQGVIALTSGEMHQAGFMVFLVLYGVGAFGYMTLSIARGNPWRAAIACWLASPLPMVVLATVMEGRPLAEVVDPSIGSWAFLFGDSVFLPLMAAMLALGRRQIDYEESRWGISMWWITLSALLGVAAGIIFHIVDSVNYVLLALNSPTKLFHDLVAYSVLFGGLWFGLWPVLVNRASRRYGWYALGAWSLWLAAGIADNTFHTLDGRNLHKMFDWTNMVTIPY